MLRNTARALLLSSASLLTMAAFGAHAQTVAIPGGGASLPSQDYAGPAVANNATPTSPSEEATFNAANTQYGFQYFYASSGRGQAAFSMDSPAQWQYTGQTPLPTTVKYAGSDAFLDWNHSAPLPQTINGYTYTSVAGIPGTTADYPLRMTQDGALIQVPVLGLGIAIPAASGVAAVRTNGTLQLTDSDLCGIFSGKITDYGSISHPLSGLSGPITVYYRGDSSGTSFLFTNHLKAACNANNSNFPAAGLASVPSTTFANIFNVANGGTVPSNFKPETGSAALATALAGTVTSSGGSTVGQPGDPTGIGYLSTDFTDISKNGAANTIQAPNPPGGFIDTRKLFDAAVQGQGQTAFLTPTVKNITLGLGNPGAGSTNPKPPTGANATNPLNWVPSIPVVKKGYAVVGYTDWELAQCYADPNVASGLTAFLTAHFQGQAAYASTINSNGFTVPAKAYSAAIIKTFLMPSSPLAIASAGTAGKCASVSGR